MRHLGIDNTRTNLLLSAQPRNHLNRLKEAEETSSLSLSRNRRLKLLFTKARKRNSAVCNNVFSQVQSRRKASSVTGRNNHECRHEHFNSENYTANSDFTTSFFSGIKEQKILLNNSKYYVMNVKIVRLDPKAAIGGAEKYSNAKLSRSEASYRTYKNSYVSLMPGSILALPRRSRLLILKKTSKNSRIREHNDSNFLQIRPAEKARHSPKPKQYARKMLPQIRSKQLCTLNNNLQPSPSMSANAKPLVGVSKEDLRVELDPLPKINFRIKIKLKSSSNS